MNANRKILFRAGAVAILVLIAGAMFILGRGHTVYLDNKAVEYNGRTYAPPYKITVFVGGKQAAKLYDAERGKAICIGQKLTMSLEIAENKGGGEKTSTVSLRLPYRMDGIIINLPALLAGLPEDAYLSEFIAVQSEPETGDEDIVTDEFNLPED